MEKFGFKQGQGGATSQSASELLDVVDRMESPAKEKFFIDQILEQIRFEAESFPEMTVSDGLDSDLCAGIVLTPTLTLTK